MNKVLQIIDANQNRAMEGLRVVEEVCRFILEDESLTQKLKDLRHRIKDLIGKFYGFDLLKGRDIERDAGKELDKVDMEKGGYIGIVNRNFSRVKEALRVIEEFSKLSKEKVSPEFKETRFEVYEIEKEVYNVLKRFDYKKRMKGLYAIVDLGLVGDWYLEFTKEVVEGGANIVQLRGKNMKTKDFISIGEELGKLLKEKGVIFVVNDRADVAFGIGADGVHLGQEDIPPSLARDILGKDRIIGISTHNLDEIKRALEEDVDYVSFGPIYKTPTKPELSPLGTTLLSKARSLVSIPLFAIGGITGENIEGVIESGVDGVVCASYLARADSTMRAAQRISKRFKE